MGHLVGDWPQSFGSRKCFVGLCAAVLLSGLFTSLALHVQDVTHHWSFCPEVTQKCVANPQEMEPIRSHLGDNPNIDESYPEDSCGCWSCMSSLVKATTHSRFLSDTTTDFNYANQLQLNDSGNNGLLTESWLFLRQSCLPRPLVVSGTTTAHS